MNYKEGDRVVAVSDYARVFTIGDRLNILRVDPIQHDTRYRCERNDGQLGWMLGCELKQQENKMQKSDLRDGMTVKTRDGGTYRVSHRGNFVPINAIGGERLAKYYNEDLTRTSNAPGVSDVDIVAVIQPATEEKILWERQDSPLVKIKGKEYSEDTLDLAIKAYVNN